MDRIIVNVPSYTLRYKRVSWRNLVGGEPYSLRLTLRHCYDDELLLGVF